LRSSVLSAPDPGITLDASLQITFETKAMTTVDSTRRALERFRQQVARSVESSGLSSSATATGGTAGPPSSGSAPTIRQSALRRLRSLSPTDSAYDSKAVRAFVESVLEAEFGERITNSAEYQEMLGVVCAQILGDAALTRTFRAMINRLLTES
jgi:hypothetical protein